MKLWSKNCPLFPFILTLLFFNFHLKYFIRNLQPVFSCKWFRSASFFCNSLYRSCPFKCIFLAELSIWRLNHRMGIKINECWSSSNGSKEVKCFSCKSCVWLILLLFFLILFHGKLVSLLLMNNWLILQPPVTKKS